MVPHCFSSLAGEIGMSVDRQPMEHRPLAGQLIVPSTSASLMPMEAEAGNSLYSLSSGILRILSVFVGAAVTLFATFLLTSLIQHPVEEASSFALL